MPDPLHANQHRGIREYSKSPQYIPERGSLTLLVSIQHTDHQQNVLRQWHVFSSTERTVHDLTEKISKSQQIDPKCVARLLHVNHHSSEILTDHDVRELPEGQDMIVEFIRVLDSYGDTETFEIKLSY
ncbi:hypothetical protein FE257_004881 [Aspergillus nanangensis]|uniref:Uncharacterized protein n=1 Tax=Aspergillus nanangensis TaxID=2582783 RepID=A0AAD4GN17_ASPNN|nr:hypothetical protein FE257_004881 [Aspergillus nanangensis]